MTLMRVLSQWLGIDSQRPRSAHVISDVHVDARGMDQCIDHMYMTNAIHGLLPSDVRI